MAEQSYEDVVSWPEIRQERLMEIALTLELPENIRALAYRMYLRRQGEYEGWLVSMGLVRPDDPAEDRKGGPEKPPAASGQTPEGNHPPA